jgi:hypothetical protein
MGESKEIQIETQDCKTGHEIVILSAMESGFIKPRCPRPSGHFDLLHSLSIAFFYGRLQWSLEAAKKEVELRGGVWKSSHESIYNAGVEDGAALNILNNLKKDQDYDNVTPEESEKSILNLCYQCGYQGIDYAEFLAAAGIEKKIAHQDAYEEGVGDYCRDEHGE